MLNREDDDKETVLVKAPGNAEVRFVVTVSYLKHFYASKMS